jgi:hypothetical protein
MTRGNLDTRRLWYLTRRLGLASIGMSILGFVSIVNSVAHQHTPGSIAGALTILALLSGFCAYISVKMAQIMRCIERTEAGD